MPLLRVESETIPAKTVKTTIIGIPAAEWKSMRLKKGALTNIPLLLFFIFLLGIMIFGVVYWPGIIEQYNIDISSGKFFYTTLGIGLTVALPMAVAVVFIPLKGVQLENSLLKKHGWDGNSRYRVELSEGGAWFD